MWIPGSCTVTFDVDGGTSVDSKTVTYGTLIPTDGIDTQKEDFTFGGWYKDAARKQPWNFSSDKVMGDMVLYARWRGAMYTVSFDVDGGSPVADQSVENLYYAERPQPPTKAHFNFDGWYKEAEYLNLWDFDNDPITADTVIYAKWTAIVYTVGFDTAGGGVIAEQKVEYNKLATRPADPILFGYIFDGWDWDFEDPVTEDITIKAKWIICKFTVAFDADDGSEIFEIEVEFGALLTPPTPPTKDGFVFGGWYYFDEDLTAHDWDFSVDTVINDMVLYVRWDLPVSKKPFPWWIIVVCVAALILLAVIIILLAGHKKRKLKALHKEVEKGINKAVGNFAVAAENFNAHKCDPTNKEKFDKTFHAIKKTGEAIIEVKPKIAVYRAYKNKYFAGKDKNRGLPPPKKPLELPPPPPKNGRLTR